MKIVVAGASGLIGSALIPVVRGMGHEVFRLVRRTAKTADEIEWDPASGRWEEAKLKDVDGFVNLAGENVGAGRWTAKQREKILRSRVDCTRTLVAAMTKGERKPQVFVSASATGFYGDRGDDVLTEKSERGVGFLPGVCLAWETHAENAARAGVRTALLRFGVVLARDGGALAKMLPIYRLGVGGRLGNGRQWMSWVSLVDVVRVIGSAIEEERYAGPLNVVAPEPVTNAEFTGVLARVLRRPAVLPVPAWVLRAGFGQMADETLLASTRAVPQRLSEMGFRFQHETVGSALRAVLK